MSRVADRLEIQELFARFSHVFDNGDLDGLGLVFTKDAVIELRRGEGRTFDGLESIAEFVVALGERSPDHQTLDTLLFFGEDGTALARSRYLALVPDGSAHNGDYYDELRQTPDGWRIARRVSVPRYPLEGPVSLPEGYLDAWKVNKGR